MPAFKDITGRRFGKLTAVEVVERRKGVTVWRYLCECGQFTDRVAENVHQSVRQGHTPACEKCRTRSTPPVVEPRRLEIAGQKFGKLTAIQPTGRTNDRRYAIWRFECECGNVVEKVAATIMTHAANGGHPNCGAAKCKRIVRGGQGRKQAHWNYRTSAKVRGLEFTLTDEQMDELFASNCYYCNAEPREGQYTFTYNGIDRVDNTKGYTPDNVVACCKTCNNAKKNMSVEEFLNWADRVWMHQHHEPPRHR